MERTRGTMVRTLANMPGHPFHTYALTFGPNREVYVICSEGVGWLVTESEPLTVDTMAGGYSLSLAEVLTAADAGTDVDLADFVRVFGARLETNFRLWHRRING